MTYSSIIPLTKGLLEFLQGILNNEDNGPPVTPIAKTLLTNIIMQVKLKLVPYELRSLTRVATFLDAWFKKDAFGENEMLLEEVKNATKSMFSNINANINEDASVPISINNAVINVDSAKTKSKNYVQYLL